MLIFLHIPKCGGKSLRRSLVDSYGSENISLYYNNPLRKYKKNQFFPLHVFQGLRLLKPRKLPLESDVVYGHFCLNDFKSVLKTPHNFCAAFFRDPIELIGSYIFYSHQKQAGNEEVYIEDIDFIKYVEDHKLQHFYRSFLGDFQPQDLDFIGITEHYADSLNLFNEKFGANLTINFANKTENAPEKYASFFKQQGLLDDMEDLMSMNTEIYNQALKIFEDVNNGHEYTNSHKQY